ncbi:MAG TPA: hypothetical protein VIU61_15250, partial [Kofleriaceae bacterium]
MRRALVITLVTVVGACGSQDASLTPVSSHELVAQVAVRLPSTPGEHAPSLVTIDRSAKRGDSEL